MTTDDLREALREAFLREHPDPGEGWTQGFDYGWDAALAAAPSPALDVDVLHRYTCRRHSPHNYIGRGGFSVPACEALRDAILAGDTDR